MPEGYSNSDWLAQGNTLEGQYSPTQLFTAEDDVKSAAALYKTNQNIAVLTILAKDATGDLVQWDPTAAAPAPQAYPVGVAAADMDTRASALNGDTYGPYYCGGCFNPELLVWPASLASASHDLQSAALERWGAPFRVKRLL